MKKSKVLEVMILSAALLALVVLPTFPTIRAQDYSEKNACKCNHFDITAENTAYDEYTGIALTARYYPGYKFFWMNFSFVRGLGGFYSPAPPDYNTMYSMREWFENGMGYRIYYLTDTPNPWFYPFNPFGAFNYYAQNFSDYGDVIQGEYGGCRASSWFRWPPFPWAFWYCSGDLGQVYWNQ
jgi:hypothetical protein